MACRRLTMVLGVVLGLLGATANAQIEVVNDPALPASADGFNITRDWNTGHEWLDVDLSVGRSFADLTGLDGSNEFAPGGDFEGFRYARRLDLTGAINGPQLRSLFKTLEISPFGFSSQGGYAVVRRLLEVIGCFGACASYGYTFGTLLSDDGMTESQQFVEAFGSQGNDKGRSGDTNSPVLQPPNDVFTLERGNFLIRDIEGFDGDADGVVDVMDNCLFLANPQQTDADGDLYGNACDADYDNSCVVAGSDLGLLRVAFFTSDPVVDLNDDGIVNFLDLGRFRELFFEPPGPSGLTDICGI